jgi:protein arginine N-methyltransferase 5
MIGLGVVGITLPTEGFLTNKKGYPTLSKKMQSVVEFVMKRGGEKIRWVLSGQKAHHPGGEDANMVDVGSQSSSEGNHSGYLHYLQYLFHVRNRPSVVAVLDNEEASAERGYLDYLQAPLQPLADNLEFMTYETFEKDPVKYRNYENAVLLAMEDGSHEGKWVAQGGKVNIMVVGAGRGPLVQASLNAVKRFNDANPINRVTPNMLAVEKNKNAVVFLHSRCQLEEDWVGVVRVITSDMRDAMVSESDRADIVVSELLGSFGDNELSPECLDGAQRSGLIRSNAVSIPTDYVSFIAPLSSAKLHQEAKAQVRGGEKESEGMRLLK